MALNWCHRNVKELIDGAMPFLHEWTGLAYNAHEQGWVNHSWGVSHATRGMEDGAIIETTSSFDAYYGYRTVYDENRRQLVESQRLREERPCTPSTS